MGCLHTCPQWDRKKKAERKAKKERVKGREGVGQAELLGGGACWSV